jgi:hypothetical protein
MSDAVPTLRFGLSFDELAADIYFQPDFVALHNRPEPIDRLVTADFIHAAGARVIPGTRHTDLWTPHGYGGPLARDGAALAAGLASWRARQRQAGRVAEFIRFHPCVDAEAHAGLFDRIAFNRPTVMVDLTRPAAARRAGYSQSTRRFLRKAEQRLAVRRLDADDAPLFKHLYDAMLDRRGAADAYRFPDGYFRDLLAAPWCAAWCATPAAEGTAVAAACFLATASPVAHYHLGGADAAGLAANAQYLLFETAFDHFAAAGARWLHLGGGRTAAPDDTLWQFKRRFSDVHARFCIGGLIHDPAAYQALGGSRGGQFLGYRASPSS